MSDSETSSSEVKVKYQNLDNNLESGNKKPQTTDTDYYFGIIANPNKIINKDKKISESSDLENLLKDSNSEKSSSSRSSSRSTNSKKSKISNSSHKSTTSESRVKYDKIMIGATKGMNTEKQPNTEKNSPVYLNTANVTKQQPKGEPIKTTIVEQPKVLTQQEIRMKKIELLRKLCEIKSKGYQLSKDYDFNSSLDEMEYEYDLLKSFADKRNGVKIFKSGLLQAVSVIEFLNDKYDPFDFHLTGWGDHMSVEVDSWEDVLEEIYEKYKGTGRKLAPEIKLLYLIIASASAFHFTRSQAAKLPGLDSVLASNPGLLSKIMNPGKKESSQFMTQQEINIERQKEELRKKEAEAKMVAQQNQQQYIQQLQEQIAKQNEAMSQLKQNESNIISAAYNPVNANLNQPLAANGLPPSVPAAQLRPVAADIRAPDQVKNILNRIHNIQSTNTKPSNTDTQDDTSSNNDRLLSETTLSDKKKGRKPLAKKSSISIF
jgi:hypothetical protein